MKLFSRQCEEKQTKLGVAFVGGFADVRLTRQSGPCPFFCTIQNLQVVILKQRLRVQVDLSEAKKVLSPPRKYPCIAFVILILKEIWCVL